ncbi:molybdenum cofactor synthesis domain protein [Segniliparus rotundus DSM 44985]|uniref:Molybdopterin molybdenumtransferase n=1 Tax=Segniliparus rotundus (strain ATCC BAA-972 / CDC 1076 / CIP 108378 / DSM 44985 / JCM 13578) TaxID=640132 RepID=D6ZBR2_SEGRD|nr:gephyrin-like molybdotransferase Glp [Segniliparus rotundus]ADG96889.1 molybdenum cofactor synthesis domain protein [Segniliparus rotundus DSM 44985]
MRSVEEHQRRVAELIRAPKPVRLPLGQALGRVLAEDITAQIPLPSFDNSAMDGYAARAEDLAGASEQHPVVLPVAADIPAGSPATFALAPQSVHRIMTGACLPPGADAILPFESTDRGAEFVRAHAPAKPGAHIRRAGEDLRRGERALAAGARLRAPQIGLIAALGFAEVAVFAPLQVLVLSTGSELTAPGQPLERGRIYESNSPMLAAAVEETGAVAHRLRFVPDSVAAFHARIGQALAELGEVDLILTSGGVSAGEYEVVKQAFAEGQTEFGQVEFVSVAMQPGKPQGCGVYSPARRAHAESAPPTAGAATALVALPGNPVSAQVSFEVFLREPLAAAMGHPRPRRQVLRLPLAEPVPRSPAGKRQFLRGVLAQDRSSVSPFGPPGSHFLRSMALSDCLVDIPAGTTSLPEGAEVDVWDLG